jgi:L-threonylcarbamoyladenylate synthase
MRTRVRKVDPERPDPATIQEAAALLRRGALVAFPTETVYGLGANLEDPQAIQELYLVKQRPFTKQVTLHIADHQAVEAHEVLISPLGRQLMARYWPGPLTLILARSDGSTLGFRMPRHPVALALLRAAQVPVVAPSANQSGLPPPQTGEEVLRDLGDKIDLVLDAGRTPLGVESTVVDASTEPPRILRDGAIGAEIKRLLEGGFALRI